MTRLWTVGTERETSPGCYAMLSHEADGWTLWRFETVNGVSWAAAKPAIGKAEISPLGVAQALWGGTPRIELRLSKTGTTDAHFHATHHYGLKGEYRRVGDRFTKPIDRYFDPLQYDGGKLEVFLQSMPGPKSFSKIVRDQGIIDMTGVKAIISARASK